MSHEPVSVPAVRYRADGKDTVQRDTSAKYTPFRAGWERPTNAR